MRVLVVGAGLIGIAYRGASRQSPGSGASRSRITFWTLRRGAPDRAPSRTRRMLSAMNSGFPPVQIIDDHDVGFPASGLSERALDALVETEPGRGALSSINGDRRRSQPAQHLHPRPQRRRAFALPAGPPRHHRPGSALGYFPRQSSLAHTWLPGQQNDAAEPRRSLCDQRIENGEPMPVRG
jgi:hypothetical protein